MLHPQHKQGIHRGLSKDDEIGKNLHQKPPKVKLLQRYIVWFSDMTSFAPLTYSTLEKNTNDLCFMGLSQYSCNINCKWYPWVCSVFYHK